MNRKEVMNMPFVSEEPRGFTNKVWVFDNINKLIKYNNKLYHDQDVMEKLASNILKASGIDSVNVELGYNSKLKQYCAIIDTFLTNVGDVSYSMDFPWTSYQNNNVLKEISSCFAKVNSKFNSLHKINDSEIRQLIINYIRIIFGNCIIGNEDGKLKNFAIIFNELNYTYRLAPSFDNALSFHNYNYPNLEPICYIGNQHFPVDDVLVFIITYYYPYIEDIIILFNEFVEKSMDSLLLSYSQIIPHKKIEHIRNYLININQKIIKLTPTKTNVK